MKTLLVILGSIFAWALAPAPPSTVLRSATQEVEREPAWRRIATPLDVAWPRDHGAHLDVRTEWWYVTGELAAPDGSRCGFQVTIFRRGLDPRPASPGESRLRARHALAAHVALVDFDRGDLRHVERLRRMGAGLAWASELDLDVGVEDVAMQRRADGTIAVKASARDAGFALDLVLQPECALVLHGQGGVSRKGPETGNASAYASFPRLAVRGTLQRDGVSAAVTGAAWFDHEWGTSQLGDGVVGWDWAGLRLDDGRALMLYRLRNADGSASAFSGGTWIDCDGTARVLSPTDFEFTPLETWTSASTGAQYPIRWSIAVPTAGIRGELTARRPNCEIDARASTGTIYWEGPTRLEGTVSGAGYLELAGYARSLAGEF